MREFLSVREFFIYLIGERGYSKYRIAKELGISTSTHVGNILTGYTKRPGKDLVEAIEKRFKVTIKGE